jgi:N-acetylglucosaminyl-diphospho-decaprenol L-rhamnosyltransferase
MNVTGQENRENKSPQPDVSVIYVNWNCADEIEESIKSLREKTVNCSYEIVVVDNDSPLGIGSLVNDPGLRLIVSDKNSGFGAGCNIGAAAAEGRFLLFLNPDTRLLNNVLGELTCFLEGHPEAGIVGALVEDSDGTILFDGGRSLPSLLNEFLQHSTLCFRFPKGRWTSKPYISDWDHLSTREVGSVIGACMMMKSERFRAMGGFDEAFFLYCEEVDLCYRMHQAGSGVWYVHTARVLHKERQSTLQLYGSVSRVVLQNLKSQNYYFQKHRGRVIAFLWRGMLVSLYMLRYLFRRDPSYLEYAKWGITA